MGFPKIPRVFLILLLFSWGCLRKDSVPEGLIQPPAMRSILLDMQASQVYVGNLAVTPGKAVDRDLQVKQIYREILEIHQVTEKHFLISYHYYEMHPILLKAVYDSMLSEVNRRRAALDSMHLKSRPVFAP